MGAWIAVAAAGLVVGFGIHGATPYLAHFKEKRRPFRFPWVELLTALLFLLLYSRFGFAMEQVPWYLFAALLAAVTATDVLAKIIPDRVTYPGALLGLACSAIWPAAICGFLHHETLLHVVGLDPGALGAAALSVAGALLSFGLFESMRRIMSALANMQVMGMGDSKLLLMAGAFLGPEMAIFALLPGILCGLVIGLAYTRIFKSPHFPFGPALGLGAFLTLLYHGPMADALGAGLEWMARLEGATIWIVQIALLGLAVGLMIRVRRRAARYTKEIEEDYARLDEKSE